MVRRVLALLLLSAVIAGCAGGSDETPPSAAALEAQANATSLDFTGELATTEMLDVRSGEITALDDIVTGDRAILLWYWAPD